MLTINEYKNKHDLSNEKLSELLNVSEVAVARWSRGEEASAASVKKLNAIGIDHPVTRHQRKSVKKEVKVEKPKFDSKILKEYQLSVSSTDNPNRANSLIISSALYFLDTIVLPKPWMMDN